MNTERCYTPPETTLANYERMLTTLGIERAVFVQPSIFGTDNRAICEALSRMGLSRARGVAIVDSAVSKSMLEGMNTIDVRGVWLNLMFREGIGLDHMERLADRLKEFGCHLQFLLNARDLVDLSPRLKKLAVNIVMNHMGYMSVDHGIDHPGFQTLLDRLKGGAWVKLSGNYRISKEGPPYRDAIPFAQALIKTSPQRVVWGTDWPHPALQSAMPNEADLLNALDDWELDEAERHAILVANSAMLHGFDDAMSSELAAA